MRRSLGPLVLLAILALPALVAPVVSWHPEPSAAQPTEEAQVVSYDYYAPLELDGGSTEAGFQTLHGGPGILRDAAIASPLSVTLTSRYQIQLASDAAPIADLASTDERVYVARARPTPAVADSNAESDEPAPNVTPLPFHALLVLEAQRTIVAVGLSVHPGVSSAVTRLDAVPVPSIPAMQAAAFTTTSDAVPGWLLQVTWVLLLVAIGLALRPALLAGAFTLFSRFNQGDILDNERRGRLFAAIQADPGATFGELCQRAQLAAGVAQHHLRLLEQHELVRRARDGRATRFYPQGPRFEPPALRNATRQRLVDLVRQDPAIDTKTMAQQLGQRPQSTWHHLQVLRDAGILVASRHGRSMRWNILTR